jgi:hypothetical protein
MLFSLLFMVVACGPQDPLATLQACEDLPCRSAALVPAWTADPAGTQRWLLGLEDDTVQATLIEGLALELPDEAASLCRELPPGSHGKARCQRRVVRPHLSGPSKRGVRPPRVAADAAPGPRSSTLPLLEQGEPPWSGADPDTLAEALDGCALTEPRLCARTLSREGAARGDWEQAGTACLAGDPAGGDDYSECLFQAAEAAAEERGAAGLGDALRLCSWSSYGPMCVAHSLTLVGPRVPGADRITAADVAAAQEVVGAIEDASPAGGRTRATLVDRYWSSWTGTTVLSSASVDGRLASLLPPEAQHHLPVALAYRLMSDRDPASLELEALASELRSSLADPGTEPSAAAPPKLRKLVTKHRIQTWATDRGPESGIPAAWVLGPGRRAVSDDPDAELRIAILEAAVQLREPPPAGFFLAVVGDTDHHQLLRWTGARIGAQLDPDAAALLHDPDALVNAALRPRQRKPRALPAG